ncbi:MAG: hypothetical protein RBT72_10110 [Spirochaetia bacterium]|jgi:hypothetical protein|nr:hypothetical protein [Spirochaetia bacterium]
MPQISLYIDEKTLKKVESAARSKKMSISKWVAEQLRFSIEPSYPPDFEDLFGSVHDDSFVAPQQGYSADDSARDDL